MSNFYENDVGCAKGVKLQLILAIKSDAEQKKAYRISINLNEQDGDNNREISFTSLYATEVNGINVNLSSDMKIITIDVTKKLNNYVIVKLDAKCSPKYNIALWNWNFVGINVDDLMSVVKIFGLNLTV